MRRRGGGKGPLAGAEGGRYGPAMTEDATGRSRTFTDEMDPARAQALAATLGLPFDASAPLIPFAHQVYFWDAQPEDRLGRDGHPALGPFLPDLGLPRRMWAGGRLAFHRDLFAGRPAVKTTTVEAVARKTGRSGPLGFVTLRHEVRQDGAPAVTEWQDIVYREDPAPGSGPAEAPEAPAEAEVREERQAGPTTLFRYSALTFNGHRIHYDPDYARQVEGYAGLVTHGPLLAQWLMLLAAQRGRLTRFSFRAVAPLICPDPATICRAGNRLWAAGPDGRLRMTAEAGWD